MRRLSLTILALAATLVAVVASEPPQRGRALALEDYYRLKSVGGVEISPDGSSVVFSVSQRVEDDPAQKRENQSTTQWFRVAADGVSAPVAIAAPARGGGRGRGGRAGPSPGSGRGASTIPSPDGTWIAELRDKESPKPAPSYASDFEKRHQERFKGVTFDWKDFQRDGAPFPAPDPTAGNPLRIVVRPVNSDQGKTLVDLDIRPSNVVWHPNGRMLAFTADAKWRDPLRYAKADLWTVTLDGQLTQLTNDGFNYSDIEYSPDGKYLSYARTFGTDYVIQQKLNHGGPRDLYLLPTSGGAAINLTEHWDLEPDDSRWSPDGRFIYFTAATGGETHLFRVSIPADTGARVGPAFRPGVQQVTTGPRRIGSLTYDKAMTKIAYTVAVHESPGDVYVANIDGTNERRLTNVHADDAAEIAFNRAERLQWASKDGTKIEGWLMYPHAYDRAKGPYPLIVQSHGGPHAATGYSFDFKKQYFAANGYFVLDTNFRSSTGYGEKFKWATWGAWGDKDGEDVMSGIDYVIARYPIDAKRVGHIGHSYGGFMTNWLITQYPDRFAAAIAGAGISNWISDYGTADIYRTKETEFFGPPWDDAARQRMIRQSPLTYAGRVKTPTLFVHGEVDQRVPYEEGEQMYFALRRRGVPAKMIQYAGQSHGISGHNNVVHRLLNELAWFDKYLKPARSTGTSASR